jgi:hypothetical protein
MPHGTARGRFDEVALEVELCTLAHHLGQHREGFCEGTRLSLQIALELRASGPRVGWAAGEHDRLPRVLRLILSRLEVLKPPHYGLYCRCELLRGDVAVSERSLERVECRLGLDTCKLHPLLLEALLEILLGAQREGETTFSFAALVFQLAQRGLDLIRGFGRAFQLLLERRELVLGFFRSDLAIVQQLLPECSRKRAGRRSGAGVEPTEPWVARPHRF